MVDSTATPGRFDAMASVNARRWFPPGMSSNAIFLLIGLVIMIQFVRFAHRIEPFTE